MSRDNVNNGRAKRGREEDRCDGGPAREEAPTGGTRMDFSPVRNWTLDEYYRECADLMSLKPPDAMAVDVKSLVMYNRNHFECDTGLGAWRRRLALLSRWCVRILVDSCSVVIVFVRCEQELCYCRKLQEAIDANMELAERYPELKCWCYDKPYTNTYLMRGRTLRTRALMLEICQKEAVRSLVFVEWHYLKIFTAAPKNQYRHYMFVTAF